MAAKAPVSLAVHRNTVERRRKRTLAKDAKTSVEGIIRENDVRAYAFVAIDAEGRLFASWDTGSIMPMWAFAETMTHGLRLDMESSGVEETWKPNLTLKG